jgi:hypothetical protein
VIDRPLETRSPNPLRLRTLTSDDAHALLHGERYDLDVLALVGDELTRPA